MCVCACVSSGCMHACMLERGEGGQRWGQMPEVGSRGMWFLSAIASLRVHSFRMIILQYSTQRIQCSMYVQTHAHTPHTHTHTRTHAHTRTSVLACFPHSLRVAHNEVPSPQYVYIHVPVVVACASRKHTHVPRVEMSPSYARNQRRE
jgi:hypothetical protein